MRDKENSMSKDNLGNVLGAISAGTTRKMAQDYRDSLAKRLRVIRVNVKKIKAENGGIYIPSK